MVAWLAEVCEIPSRAAQRRARVIDVARKLFMDHGFHATGIAQIARESGVAVGQLYRDFAAKEDIVAAIVRADCSRYLAGEALREAIARGDRDSARAWLRHFVTAEDDLEEGRLFAEIVAESSRNPRIAAIFTGTQDELRGLIEAALALLAPGEGVARRRSLMTDAIVTLSLGLLQYRLMRADLDTGALVEALHGILDREVDALVAAAG